MSEELLPCPFCGTTPGEPTFYSEEDYGWHFRAKINCCVDMESYSEMERIFSDDPEYEEKIREAKKEALDKVIRNWNTRVTSVDRIELKSFVYSKYPKLDRSGVWTLSKVVDLLADCGYINLKPKQLELMGTENENK